MVGVDIDDKLIARALSKLKSHTKLPTKEGDTATPTTFPENVTFRAGNILDDTVEAQEASYDVVIWYASSSFF